MKLVVLASGRGSNFQALAEAMRRGELGDAQFQGVVSDRPDAPVLVRANRLGIPHHVVPRNAFPSRSAFDEAILQAVADCSPDWIVLAGYMRILPAPFVQRFRWRILNIHPALLPEFPGAHAIHDALQAGVRETGVTVHFVDEGVDTGPIIAQRTVPVHADDTEESLAERIHAIEHQLYPRVVRWCVDGRVSVDGRRVLLDGQPVRPSDT